MHFKRHLLNLESIFLEDSINKQATRFLGKVFAEHLNDSPDTIDAIVLQAFTAFLKNKYRLSLKSKALMIEEFKYFLMENFTSENLSENRFVSGLVNTSDWTGYNSFFNEFKKTLYPNRTSHHGFY